MNNDDSFREIDLMQYLRIIIRRRWAIVTFACALIVFTGIFTFTATPIYRATARLLLEEDSSRRLNIEDELGYRIQASNRTFYNTQLQLFRSRLLAEKVSNNLKLPSRWGSSSTIEPKKSIFASIKDIVTLKWLRSNDNSDGSVSREPSQSDPNIQIALGLQSSINIRPIRDTTLIDIEFSSGSPTFAAEIVNTFAEEYIRLSIDIRSANTQMASNFLNEELSVLRDDINGLNREIQRLGVESDISTVTLNASERNALTSYDAYDREYHQARIDRETANLKYQRYTTLTIDSLTTFTEDLALNELQNERRRLIREVEEKNKVWGPNLPEMVQLRENLASTERQLEDAIQNAKEAARNDWQAALERERRFKRMRDEEESKLGSSGSQLNLLQIKLKNKTNQLDQLTGMQEEISVSSRLDGYNTSKIKIIDRALVPTRPVSPNKKKNMLFAIILGIFGGVGLAFLLEYLDNSVKGPEDVQKLTGISSLGVIPYLPPEGVRQKKRGLQLLKYLDYYHYGEEQQDRESELAKVKDIELVNHLHPQFFISEDYRTIRTSILFSNPDSPPKTVLVTSAMPQEGKTTTATNLAVAFSQLAEKVLIVDTDLRKPRMHNVFKVKNVGGLSSFLTGKIELKDAIKMSAIQNIWVLPSGPIPPNPAELLNSKKMKEMIKSVEGEFDIVIFDSPPVLAAIDTVIMANIIQNILMVVHAGKTQNRVFVKAVEDIRKSGAKIIGAVLNVVKMDHGAYFYKDYYHYGQQSDL